MPLDNTSTFLKNIWTTGSSIFSFFPVEAFDLNASFGAWLIRLFVCLGDQLYRMDYREFAERHAQVNADITVAALPCDEKKASAFGLMKIDDTGRILEFAEKPKGDALKAMAVDTTILGLDPAR